MKILLRIFLPLIIVGISDSADIPHHVDEVSNYLRTETGTQNNVGHTFAYEHVTSDKIIAGCEGSKSASGEMKVHFYFIDATGKRQSILNPYESFDVVMPSPDALPAFLRTKKFFMHDLCFPEACEAGPCGTPLKTAEWRIPTFPWFSSLGNAEKGGAPLNIDDNVDSGSAEVGVAGGSAKAAAIALAKDSSLGIVTSTTYSQASSNSQSNDSLPSSAGHINYSVTNSSLINSSLSDTTTTNSTNSDGTVSYTTVTTSSSSSPGSTVSISCTSNNTPTTSATAAPTCGCCENCPAYKAIEQLILAKLESQFVANPWPFPTVGVPGATSNFPWTPATRSNSATNRERTDQFEPTWPFNVSPQTKQAKEATLPDPSFFASLPGAIRGQAPVIYYPSCDPDAFYQPAIINYCTDYSDTPSGDFQQDSPTQELLNASETLVTPN